MAGCEFSGFLYGKGLCWLSSETALSNFIGPGLKRSARKKKSPRGDIPYLPNRRLRKQTCFLVPVPGFPRPFHQGVIGAGTDLSEPSGERHQGLDRGSWAVKPWRFPVRILDLSHRESARRCGLAPEVSNPEDLMWEYWIKLSRKPLEMEAGGSRGVKPRRFGVRILN